MVEINREGQFDMALFKQIKEHAEYLKRQHTARNSMFDDMESMLMMVWEDEEKVKRKMENIKLTKHPGARNTLLGAIRLMIAADPVWSVPFDSNEDEVNDQSEKIEKMASAIWDAAGRVRDDPVHYDVVLSMLAFAEVHMPVTRTADMVAYAKGGNKAAQIKAEEIAEATPYVFDVWDPRMGYPEIGRYGLTSYYREVSTTSGQVLDEFGETARKVLDKSKRYDTVKLCHFWDYETRMIWLKEKERPLIQEASDGIPVVVQLGEGSRLFSKVEYWRQPFLYTLWKSGLWSRQNLMLTVLYTMIFAIGSNPMFLYKRNHPDKHLSIDYDVPGKVAEIDRDEDFSPLLKAVIDPSLLQGSEIAEQLVQQSTIYSQTLGEPLGKNAPFSMVALLHQAGRLPLIVPQRKSNWALADGMKMALRWLKADGRTAKAGYGRKYAELSAKDIPDRFEMEAALDIALPQDKLQLLNVATQATMGEDPLMSKRWAREEMMGVGQSDQMQKEIWGEKAADLNAQAFFADQASVLKQRLAMLFGGGQPGMAPGKQPGKQPGMMPGREQPGMPPPTEQPGLQGLPPEMGMNGGQPPVMPGDEEMMG